MKKFLVSFAVFAAMFLMIGCGGSDNGDEQTYCEEDADKYVCSAGGETWHFFCKKGEESSYLEWGGFYFSTWDNDYTRLCKSGCDESTGKCIPECAKGQYKCDDSSTYFSWIYTCDDDRQWEYTHEKCEHGCAKELSESILDICAD